jgi:hypothetical protein
VIRQLVGARPAVECWAVIPQQVNREHLNFLVSHVVLLLRLAAVVSIVSGLVGGYLWLANLLDISDGDDMRWGFLHNPLMGFRLFNETILLISLWALFACSAAVGLGGLLLLVPLKWGAWLVTLQARVSIIVHSVVAFFIVAMTLGFGMMPWERKALALRLGAIAVDLTLWTFLRSKAVIGFFAAQRSQRPERAFEVIVDNAEAPSPAR